MTEAEIFQQDPDKRVYEEYHAHLDAEFADDHAILSRVDFEATDMWAGVYLERLVPFLFLGTPGAGVIELILDKGGLHECREDFNEPVRGLGRDLEVEDLTLHDLSGWDADAKRNIWKRFMPGEILGTGYPSTRAVFVRTPLEDQFRARYPECWTE